MKNPLRLLLPVLMMSLLAVGGCAQDPYLSGYAFYPQPAVVNIRQRNQPDKPPPVTVLASVLGVRREDARQHMPQSVAVRMRFENTGDKPIECDPASLELTTGTLHTFAAPELYPAGMISLAPRQNKSVVAYFPFPPGAAASQFNLSNLRLRWQVKIDDAVVPQTVLFERATGSSGGGGFGYAPDATY